MNAFGFLNIDKPAGMTSHDVVALLRRELRLRKLGHAGTLDPMATGVLVLCVGPATRLSEYAMRGVKCYRAEILAGVSTDTYDTEGQVTELRDASGLTRTQVVAALAQFRGDIEQLPPMFSAVKQGGRKLYELARAGQTVERQQRQVCVQELNLVDWSPPQFTLELACSAGTYVRSLAHDLGEVLGTGAHLTALTRTVSGSFRLEDARTPEKVLAAPEWQRLLIAPGAALPNLPPVQPDATECAQLLQGRAIPCCANDPDVALAQAQGPGGALLAIVERDGALWRPRKVFPPQ